jgi:hypothetical protein
VGEGVCDARRHWFHQPFKLFDITFLLDVELQVECTAASGFEPKTLATVPLRYRDHDIILVLTSNFHAILLFQLWIGI